jgi:hypothetical protein
MSDEDPRVRAAGEAFGWMEEDRWAKGPAVYLMVSAILGAMTGGVVIVLMVLR